MSVVAVRRLVAGAVIAIVAVSVVSSRGSEHVVVAQFASATNALRDQPVRVGGVKVGHVKRIALGSRGAGANVELVIDDPDVWPLHRGTRAALRFGTTVGDGARFIELHPGPDSAPVIADDGIIPAADTSSPVEFDQLFNAFDKPTRQNLRGTLANVGSAFSGEREELGSSLRRAPAALDALSSVYDELRANRDALSTLVRTGAATTAALRQRDPQLRDLLVNAAATFDELADHSPAIEQTLRSAPKALAQVTRTFRHTRGSLGTLTAFVDDLSPGARQLRVVAPDATRAITALAEVSPALSRTLAVAQRVSPTITAFLNEATPVLKSGGDAANTGGELLDCVRPYTPDAMAFLSVWGAFSAYTDDYGHFYRPQIQASPVLNGTPLNSEQSTKLLNIGYAFPTPPGFSSGDSWLRADCGVGADALDPSKDPEAVR